MIPSLAFIILTNFQRGVYLKFLFYKLKIPPTVITISENAIFSAWHPQRANKYGNWT